MLDRNLDANRLPPLVTEYIVVIKQNNEFVGVEGNEYISKQSDKEEISPNKILETIKKRKRRKRRRRKKNRFY